MSVMKNFLLVDDDYIFNFLNTKMLERIGIANKIDSVLNGKQALDLLNTCSLDSIALPDIILLDLNMPIMDGFGFLEAFNNVTLPSKENVRIVIVSSSADPRDILKAKTLGASKYLSKPITEESLRTALEN